MVKQILLRKLFCDEITKSSLLSDFPVNELVITSHNKNNKNENFIYTYWKPN